MELVNFLSQGDGCRAILFGSLRFKAVRGTATVYKYCKHVNIKILLRVWRRNNYVTFILPHYLFFTLLPLDTIGVMVCSNVCSYGKIGSI